MARPSAREIVVLVAAWLIVAAALGLAASLFAYLITANPGDDVTVGILAAIGATVVGLLHVAGEIIRSRGQDG